jgi:hypothetical protein
MATRRERAQDLFRWLVEQHSTVTYTDVAKYLGGTPRFVTPDLECLSHLLQEFQERERCDVPPIQLLVISERTGAPGYGGAEFLNPPLSKEEYLALSNEERQDRMKDLQDKALRYPHWDRVIKGVEALPDGGGV